MLKSLVCAALVSVACTTLAAEERAKEPRAETPKAEARAEGLDAMPAGTKGTSEGVIQSLEKGKLILRTAEGDLLFMPHWRGGMPKDGGGLDQDVLARLEGFKAGDRVRIAWTWEERRRIEAIEKAAGK